MNIARSVSIGLTPTFASQGSVFSQTVYIETDIMKIVAIDKYNFDDVLPLIADYQGFYQVQNIDQDKNRRFFARFISSYDRGILHAAELDSRLVAFSTLYFCFSSALASEVGVLNDLFVLPDYRGRGKGRALIEHAAEYVHGRGLGRLQWLTAQTNEAAQQLYNRFPVTQSQWILYAMST